MAESNATIRLRAVDQNVVTTLNEISTQTTNAQISAVALAGGFQLLERSSSTSVAQMAVGAKNAQLLSDNFGKLAVAGNRANQVLSVAGNAVFYTQQLAIAADGIGRAAQQYARLPEAMQAMRASGVSTYTIQQFETLTQAIRGSDIALDSLLVSSIAELGEFERAAARAGTILKSSLRFDESGNALTANAQERLENALSAQRLVNERLNNSVTSTEALRGQYEVLSSGFTDAIESQQVLEEGLKLISIGRAGGAPVNTTATLQLLTKTLNAYELQAADAAKTAAILNATVENGLTTIQELSNGFGATSAQASKANIALVDTAAAVSVLTAQGTSTAESLTGIARVSANIIDKTPQAEKELAKLELRGEKIRFDKAEIQVKGFTQALIDLYDATGGSSEILTQIFPEDVAYRTVNALLTEQGRRLSSTRDAIANADKAKLDEIFEVSQSDRVARFQRLSNRFKESIIEIGISLAPTLEPGIKALETIADRFAGLPEPVRKAIGAYLAFQIQSKAIGSAAGELIKTLVQLATNYLLVRTLSLALTGQLGKEAQAVKALIVQKKGLAAATLQLFGIDQRWRLEQENITKAVAQQGKVAQAVAAARNRVTTTTKNLATTAIAKTSGIDKEQVLNQLEQRKQQAIALLQQGTAKARQTAQEIADRFGFELPQPTVTVPSPSLAKVPVAPPQQLAAPLPKVPPLDPRVANANDLIKSDRAFQTQSALYQKRQQELALAAAKSKKAQLNTSNALKKVNSAEIELAKAKNAAISTTTNRTEALNQVKARQQKLVQAQNNLALREIEFSQLNTAAIVAENRAVAASNQLNTARNVARTKYAPLADSITQAEIAQTQAVKLGNLAQVARLKAEQAEIALGDKSKITLLLKHDAYLAEVQAKKASIVASNQQAIATALEIKLNEKQRLAELGLYKTKIFGRDMILAETGLIGSLNKVLTLNIAQIKAATIAEIALSKAKRTTAAIADLRNIQLTAETVKLAGLNIQSKARAVFGFISGGATKATSAVTGLLSPLGAIAPLMGVAAVATVALRSELFGLGADARELSKSYRDFIKAQEALNISLEKRTGLTRIQGQFDLGNSSNIQQQLLALKDTGALTSNEFTRLSTSFEQTALGGNKAAAASAEFRAELKRLQADADKVEKSLGGKIFAGIKGIPGFIGARVDDVFNTSAAGINSLLKRELVSPSDISRDRELNSLTSYFDVLGKLQRKAGDRFQDTSVAVQDYRENLALTSEVQAKVDQGIKLTNADLANESQAYKNRAEQNRSVIDQLEKDISASKDALGKVKNDEARQRLEGQISAAIRQKEALESQNAVLKQLQADTRKYLTETLPAIQTALKESADPVVALTNAQEKFDQVYITDGEGRVTKLLKPIQTLRDEAGKLVAQVQQNLAFGLFDSLDASGEAIASEKLRAIRDEQISFMENGVLTTGYRLTLAQRRDLTGQIIQLDNQDLVRAEQRNKIEIDLAKTLGQAQLETTASTNLKIAQLQQQAIAGRIAQKENEIAEFKRFGLRTIEQEIQLEQLRIQQQSFGFGVDSAELQQQQAIARQNLERQNLSGQRLLFNSQKLVAIRTEENSILGLTLNRLQNRLQVEEKSAQLSSRLSQNEVFNAQVQERLLTTRLTGLGKSFTLEKAQLNNQIAITTEKDNQRLIEADINEKKAALAVVEAREQLNLARRNGASREQLDMLKLQLERSQLNLSQQRESTVQAEFQLSLNQRISQSKLEQVELENSLETSNIRASLSAAKMAEEQAKITREYRLQSTELKSRATVQSQSLQEFNSILAFRSGELSLAGQLASSEKQKQKIAQQTAALKLRSLRTQLASEAEILGINQKQNQLQLQVRQQQTGVKLQQNVADLTQTQANISKLRATGASDVAIAAEKQQFEAQLAQRQALLIQSRSEQEEARLLQLQQENRRREFAREAELKVDQARVEAVGTLPESKRKGVARRLSRELIGKSEVGTSRPSIVSAIDGLSNFEITVPQISLPKIDFPSIDDIRADVRAVVAEFNTLSASSGNQSKYTIENISFDTPINIIIQGDDNEEITQQVEGAVYNTIGGLFRDLEQELNGR